MVAVHPRRGGLRMAALTFVASAVFCAPGVRAQSCSRTDFEGVVGQAAGVLRDLNSKNKPSYQAKLRELKAKRGWSHDVFLKEAAPLVQDDKVLDYDQKAGDLLAQINTMGQEGAGGGTADCALLDKLRGFMKSLVETQEAKWTYMFERIDAELAK